MAEWTNAPTATLKVKDATSGTDTFSFNGVAASNSAGTPENFLSAANSILGLVGKSAVLAGMTRTIQQEVTDNG